MPQYNLCDAEVPEKDNRQPLPGFLVPVKVTSSNQAFEPFPFLQGQDPESSLWLDDLVLPSSGQWHRLCSKSLTAFPVQLS
jgi:hypothetical protein